MTKFFKLPSWLVWVLVSLVAILLCAVWQWRRAMALLDKTTEELAHAKDEREKAKAERDAARKSLEEQIKLTLERARINEEAKVKTEQVEAEKQAAIEDANADADKLREEVQVKRTASDLINRRPKGRKKASTDK